MLRIKPFRAIRPDPARAPHVASLPYDVVTYEEARKLAQGAPHSFLHVVRPEIDLPPNTDPHSEMVYRTAADNFERLLREGVLIRETEPKMYLYRQVMDHHQQAGLVCCCHIDDYASEIIKKHEKTRPDKEDDRMRHILAINAQAGPVFLAYRDTSEINRLMTDDMNDRPLYHFNAPDGVTHSAWMVHDANKYVEAFGKMNCVYVADGHHRSAAAFRAGCERRQANPEHSGDEEYNWFLSVLFPASQLCILPYNRVLRDLNGQSPKQVIDRFNQIGQFSPTDVAQPDKAGSFGVYLEKAWHRLELDPTTIDHNHPIESLDVALLEQRILEPVFGITDIRTDRRIDFVGGIRGTKELEQQVDDGKAAIAFSMFPTSIEQLLAVADVGLIMPPKSTWFEPKLRSGLFVHSLE